MSSHHFVKEGQEPALMIIDSMSFDSAGPLLEWAPTVVVSSNALDNVLTYGIKIDVVVAPEKEVNNLKESLLEQVPIKIIACTSEEDILETALYFLISIKQSAVCISLNNPFSFFEKLKNFTPKIDIVLISNSIKWSFVHSGKFEKWMPSGSILMVSDPSFIDQSSGMTNNGAEFKSRQDGIIKLQGRDSFWVGESI